MASDQNDKNVGDPPTNSAIDALEKRLGTQWDAIRNAKIKTAELMDALRAELKGIEDNDCSVVVTGSLGRGEACAHSDADWVLLVDGPSDPSHAQMAREIGQRIQKIMPKPPGSTGTFGDIVPSHSLIHYIAGTRDTNENLTRRMLLLAESRPLTNSVVRERVIRNVLARYVLHDRSIQSKSGKPQRIPHFLLNDVVRYWRTIASDFASKMWERDRHGWGARNIKLRFSRKLLFIWGLLASFSGVLFETDTLQDDEDEDELLRLLAEHIRKQTQETPLDLLAKVALHEDIQGTTAKSVFAAYNEFLKAINDKATRDHLEKIVRFETAPTDETYDRLREQSWQFGAGVVEIFFDQHPQLKKLIRRYGVF